MPLAASFFFFRVEFGVSFCSIGPTGGIPTWLDIALTMAIHRRKILPLPRAKLHENVKTQMSEAVRTTDSTNLNVHVQSDYGVDVHHTRV